MKQIFTTFSTGNTSSAFLACHRQNRNVRHDAGSCLNIDKTRKQRHRKKKTANGDKDKSVSSYRNLSTFIDSIMPLRTDEEKPLPTPLYDSVHRTALQNSSHSLSMSRSLSVPRVLCKGHATYSAQHNFVSETLNETIKKYAEKRKLALISTMSFLDSQELHSRNDIASYLYCFFDRIALPSRSFLKAAKLIDFVPQIRYVNRMRFIAFHTEVLRVMFGAMKLTLANLPDLKEISENDWTRHSGGKSFLDKTAFIRAVFEMCDLRINQGHTNDHLEFLGHLWRSIDFDGIKSIQRGTTMRQLSIETTQQASEITKASEHLHHSRKSRKILKQKVMETCKLKSYQAIKERQNTFQTLQTGLHRHASIFYTRKLELSKMKVSAIMNARHWKGLNSFVNVAGMTKVAKQNEMTITEENERKLLRLFLGRVLMQNPNSKLMNCDVALEAQLTQRTITKHNLFVQAVNSNIFEHDSSNALRPHLHSDKKENILSTSKSDGNINAAYPGYKGEWNHCSNQRDELLSENYEFHPLVKSVSSKLNSLQPARFSNVSFHAKLNSHNDTNAALVCTSTESNKSSDTSSLTTPKFVTVNTSSLTHNKRHNVQIHWSTDNTNSTPISKVNKYHYAAGASLVAGMGPSNSADIHTCFKTPQSILTRPLRCRRNRQRVAIVSKPSLAQPQELRIQPLELT